MSAAVWVPSSPASRASAKADVRFSRAFGNSPSRLHAHPIAQTKAARCPSPPSAGSSASALS